jgi:hypothetical protein
VRGVDCWRCLTRRWRKRADAQSGRVAWLRPIR